MTHEDLPILGAAAVELGDKIFTIEDFVERMAPIYHRHQMKMLGQLAPDLWGQALRNAAEKYRWWSFWLP